jgi:hypothetical protein
VRLARRSRIGRTKWATEGQGQETTPEAPHVPGLGRPQARLVAEAGVDSLTRGLLTASATNYSYASLESNRHLKFNLNRTNLFILDVS